MRRSGILPSAGTARRGWKISRRSWALPRDRCSSTSRARTDCSSRHTRRRCNRFLSTCRLRRRPRSADFLKCCATGWGARKIWCEITGRPTESIWWGIMGRIWRCGGRSTGSWWGRFRSEVLRYWLGRTENMVRDNWSSYRIYLVGNYGTDLALRREINRFLVAEDPYGWHDFIGFGVKRGELRPDLDVDMIGSILEWTMDRFQDALLTEELDPGLFRKSGPVPEEKEARNNPGS